MRDDDQEWRRAVGQADGPALDGQGDAREAWEFSASNAFSGPIAGISAQFVDGGPRLRARPRRLGTAMPAGLRRTQRLDRAPSVSAPAPVAPERFDERYVDDAKLGVASARGSYRRMMRTFWALRFGVIASGLLVAVLSAAGVPIWTVATFGALAAALEAVIATTNLQNRAVVRGLYADAVARELRTFSLKIDPYAGDDAVKVLHGKLEDLRSSASSTQFKLDQTAGISPNGNS